MNNIYFGIIEINDDLFMITSSDIGDKLSYDYTIEQFDMLESLEELEIYEAMECIYQLPNSLNKESAIKLISKRPGFVYSPEIETIIQ